MTAEPLPMACTDLFRAVMVAAGWRCQCTGQCRNGHTRTENRCPSIHGGRVRLMATPADPSTPERIAATLPARELRACCPSCHSAARRASQHPKPAAQDGLFDL
ncbi:hypothetical protein ABZV28_32930 [Streptomyces sp. NPDC004981]|uniref:hypothetical protein n=1 Tax=Streptomyces sp. NPDC004981 TaxID=3156655 RepID=UPI00339E9825